MYSRILIPRRLKFVVKKTQFYNISINWIILVFKHKKGGNLIYAVRKKQEYIYIYIMIYYEEM